MQKLRTKYKSGIRILGFAMLFLFGLHFLSIHGLVQNLVYCIEEDGQVNIESESGSFLLIPSEDLLHTETPHSHEGAAYDATQDHHQDIALSSFCPKEQQITRFDQDRLFRSIDGILSTSIGDLPRSSVFQIISFTPPLMEDVITTSLQTVVLLN